MRINVTDLQDFYLSNHGRMAKKTIQFEVRSFWPNVTGMTIIGIGFAIPYLYPLMKEANSTIAVMPALQGATNWPPRMNSLCTLTDDTELPFSDMSVDLVLFAHILENINSASPLLREVWRILKGDGKILVIVPNRRGIWAQIDRTPLGYGQPYSPRQLSKLLCENMFTPTKESTVLFTPPINSRLLSSSSTVIEKIGSRVFKHFGGVILAEAEKQLYAGQESASPAKHRYSIAME